MRGREERREDIIGHRPIARPTQRDGDARGASCWCTVHNISQQIRLSSQGSWGPCIHPRHDDVQCYFFVKVNFIYLFCPAIGAAIGKPCSSLIRRHLHQMFLAAFTSPNTQERCLWYCCCDWPQAKRVICDVLVIKIEKKRGEKRREEGRTSIRRNGTIGGNFYSKDNTAAAAAAAARRKLKLTNKEEEEEDSVSSSSSLDRRWRGRFHPNPKDQSHCTVLHSSKKTQKKTTKSSPLLVVLSLSFSLSCVYYDDGTVGYTLIYTTSAAAAAVCAILLHLFVLYWTINWETERSSRGT